MELRSGDAVLRRRSDGALELRIGGVFVMDNVETGSERRLATAVLDTVAQPLHVLVGGLGLGHTLRELLRDDRVRQVTVAESEPAIPRWMYDGVLAGADLLEDERVDLRIDDVRAVVDAAADASYDAILLDVDNGPDFLVHPNNARLYEPEFLDRLGTRLRPGGHLCVWSMSRAATLSDAMRGVLDDVTVERVPVRLQGREEAYWLLRGYRSAIASPYER